MMMNEACRLSTLPLCFGCLVHWNESPQKLRRQPQGYEVFHGGLMGVYEYRIEQKPPGNLHSAKYHEMADRE